MKFNHQMWMEKALRLAFRAAEQQEVPVGAILVYNDEIISEGWNQPIKLSDPSAHAEILAMRSAGVKLSNYRLLNTTLYVTLEPCAMCIGAMLHARIKNLVFGAWDVRAGAVQSVFQILENPSLNHKIHWQGGILADQCSRVLVDFFRQRR